MTMTFKEACKDVLDEIMECLPNRDSYILVFKFLVVLVLGFLHSYQACL